MKSKLVKIVFLVVAPLFQRGFAFLLPDAKPRNFASQITQHSTRRLQRLSSFGNDYLSTLGQSQAKPGNDVGNHLTNNLQSSGNSIMNRHSQPPLAYTGTTVTDAPPLDSATTNTNKRSESLSGVSYQQVAEGLDVLYPPTELASRNAKSRTDGYWPFMKGADSEPPVEFTYGEFDALFFAQLLDEAAAYMLDTSSYDGKIVCDIGSGAGRLVIAAAALHPRLASSQGIEILPGIHEMAQEKVALCQGKLPPSNHLPLAPIELTCGSISDPAIVDIRGVDVFFIASTCMPEPVLVDIAHAIGRQCRIGTLVISTDYELLTERTLCEATGKYFQLQKLTQTDGYCWVVGGISTAFTYRLVETAAT